MLQNKVQGIRTMSKNIKNSHNCCHPISGPEEVYSPVHGQVKQYCFTLIELLVVIAIIAILAAILLPALQSARQRGMAVSCQSNAKSLGQYLQIYMNEYDGYSPVPGGDLNWWYGLRFYLPSYPIVGSGTPSVSTSPNTRAEKQRRAPIFWCPQIWKNPNIAELSGETYYVLPSWYKHFGGYMKINKVTKPGQKIMLIEYSKSGSGAAVTLPRYKNNAFPHNKQAHFTMLDGHIESQKYGVPWVEYSDSDNRSLFYKHWYPYKP